MTTGAIRHAKLQSNHHHQQTNSNTQCFTGRMPFLLPNQQCRSTEGKISHTKDLLIPNSSGSLLTLFLTTKGSWLVWGGLPCLSSASWCQYPRCQNRNWLLLIISNIWLCSAEGVYTEHRPGDLSHTVSPEQADAHSARLVPRTLADGHDCEHHSDADLLRRHAQHTAVCTSVGRLLAAFCYTVD